MVISFNDKSFLMITYLAITTIFIMTLFAMNGIAANSNIALGQANSTTTTSDSGNIAKMYVDEALKALQSNDSNGATMHIQEAQKNI